MNCCTILNVIFLSIIIKNVDCRLCGTIPSYTEGIKYAEVYKPGQILNSRPHEFPWLVQIFEQHTFNDFRVLCGGSIIHQQAVLTDASCLSVRRFSSLFVRLGEVDAVSGNFSDVGVSRVIFDDRYKPDVHKRFSQVLLILNNPISELNYGLSKYVNPICLPSKSRKFSSDFLVMNQCLVTGWHTKKLIAATVVTQDAGSRVIFPPTKYQVRWMDDRTCNSKLDDDFESNSKFGQYWMCARRNFTVNDCQELKVGSPVICPMRSNKSRYVQVGILIDNSCQKHLDSESIYHILSNVTEFAGRINRKLHQLFPLENKRDKAEL